MLDEAELKRLQRFGINESFINHFNKMIIDFISTSTPKSITEPVIIFSDIHANYPSLELTLKFAEEHDISSFISLGDLIEYNNQNDEVLELIYQLGTKCISSLKGNHDDGVLKEDYFVSTMFHDHIKKELGEKILNLPQNDIITVNGKKILLCHSNPWNVDILYLFPENKNILDYFLEKLPCEGFMFGHTHLVTWQRATNYNKFAFNPGSLGVSRDGTKSLHFAVLDPNKNKIELFETFHSDKSYSEILSKEPVKVDEFFI